MESKNNTKEEGEMEKIQLAVQAAKVEGLGDLDKEKLKNHLQNEFKDTNYTYCPFCGTEVKYKREHILEG